MPSAAAGAISSAEAENNLSQSTFLLVITPMPNAAHRIEWSAIPSPLPPAVRPPLRHHASTAVYGQSLVMYGGFDSRHMPLYDFWMLSNNVWMQLKQPKGPPARGAACMLPLEDIGGIYIFAGSSDVNGFTPLSDLWFVSVTSSTPSSVVVAATLSVANAGQRATFSIYAADLFAQKKDSLFCYDDFLLHLANDVQSIQGTVQLDSSTSYSAGSCVYQGSYTALHASLYQMTLRMNGNLVDRFPVTVNVKAESPDAQSTGIVFPTEAGPCDGLSTEESTTFIIRTFDRNGNPGMSPSKFSILSCLLPDPFWYPAIDQNDPANCKFSTSLQTNIFDSYDGNFQVTMSNTRSGNYSVSVLLQGVSVSGSPFLCSIEAGNVDSTQVSLKITTVFTVGTTSAFVLQTVDQFGNNISTAAGAAGDVITAQLLSLNDVLASEGVVVEGDRGLWAMNIFPKAVGTQRLAVIINDVPIFDEQVAIKALMELVVYPNIMFTAVGGLPAAIVLFVFIIGMVTQYRSNLEAHKTFLQLHGDVPPPQETVRETFDDVRARRVHVFFESLFMLPPSASHFALQIDKVRLDPDWVKSDEACRDLRAIGTCLLAASASHSKRFVSVARHASRSRLTHALTAPSRCQPRRSRRAGPPFGLHSND